MRIICGRHAVKAALGSNSVVKLFVAEGTNQDLLAHARRHKVEVAVVSKSELQAKAQTSKHQNVIAQATAPVTQGWQVHCANKKTPLLLVLDGIEDPRNLGACMRTAAAFGVDAVVIQNRRSASLTPGARKVASGAEEHVPLVEVVNLARELRKMQDNNFTIIGAEQKGGRDIFHFKDSAPLALVLGSEAKGMRRLTRETCDQLVSIPMPNSDVVESLNISVACGICLAVLVSQRT